MMRISIKDIARKAGVSHSTVSRALADSPLVNAETKARIKALAHEMSYAPSAIARAMSTRRTMTIGLVVTSIADPFVSEVVRGIEETALDHGYSVILCNSTGDPEREITAVRTLREKWVDAVIVTSSRVGSFYARLSEIQVPVVLINTQQPGEYTFSVRNDDLCGGQLAAEYLLQLGHRHVAYVAGPQEASSSELRLRGCQQMLHEAEVFIPSEWIVQGDGRPEMGQHNIRPLLQSGNPPTAVFCYNDMTAMGVISAIKKHGLRIPQDVSVLGYDDIAAAAYLDPPLTTIAQAKYALGQKATEMTLQLIQSRATPVQDVLIEPHLIIRASCAAPRPCHAGQAGTSRMD